MTKPLHVGHCARSGLFAALLARDGFTAGATAFEHKQGYFEVFNGAGNYDASKAIPAWANPLDITRPGIAIKSYPCCGSTHPAIDCMLELVNRHDLKPEQVARIDSWTHSRRLEHTNRPNPQSDLDAKFSVQYTLARALKDRTVKLEHFEGTHWQDPATRAILPKIHVAPYTTAQFPADNHFGAEVKVTLTDGRVLSGLVTARDDKTLTLVTPTETRTISRSDIEELTVTSQSPMPEGMLDALSAEEIRDLIGYLMQPAQVPLP